MPICSYNLNEKKNALIFFMRCAKVAIKIVLTKTGLQKENELTAAE